MTLEDTDPETMTVERLMDHLSDVHGLERCQISSAIEARSRKAKRAREIKSDRERKKRETESNYTRIRSTSTGTQLLEPQPAESRPAATASQSLNARWVLLKKIDKHFQTNSPQKGDPQKGLFRR